MEALTVYTVMEWVFGFCGVVFLGVAGGIAFFKKKARGSCTQKVKAQIADVECSEAGIIHGGGLISRYPVYEYSVDGRKFRKRSSVGSTYENFRIGKNVVLYVNPENMNEFYVPENQNNFEIVAMAVLGVLLLLVGLGTAIAEWMTF